MLIERASLVDQTAKNLPAIQRDRVWSLGWGRNGQPKWRYKLLQCSGITPEAELKGFSAFQIIYTTIVCFFWPLKYYALWSQWVLQIIYLKATFVVPLRPKEEICPSLLFQLLQKLHFECYIFDTGQFRNICWIILLVFLKTWINPKGTEKVVSSMRFLKFMVKPGLTAVIVHFFSSSISEPTI